MADLRPFQPGEFVDNRDGTISTERTVTFQDPAGRWVNVPSLWMSDTGPVDLRDDEDAIRDAMMRYEGGAEKFARFQDVTEAEAAARKRSDAGGAGAGRSNPVLLYDSRIPDAPSFAPSFDGLEQDKARATALWDATREVTRYRDNSNSQSIAAEEAYERRNRAIFEATGRQLTNPYRPGWTPEERERIHRGGGAADALELRGRAEERWSREARELAQMFPEHANAIAVDRPITDDAMQIARDAEAAFNAAASDAAELPAWRRIGNTIGGGIAGALRDPLQVATLALGGGPGTSRLVTGRIAQVMLTEALINGGVEAAVVTASRDWRQAAGLEQSTAGDLKQIGLAALFGGGFGGLLQGGREAFRLLGKAPPAALERIASGEIKPGDMDELAAALGRPLDAETARVARIAEEQPALDAEAFGPPPEGLDPRTAEQLAADALRRAEEPPEAPAPLPSIDRQARADQLDRIVRADAPIGLTPRKPQSLIEFLAASGGLTDDAGELASRGLNKRKVRGAGRLVKPGGRTLDNAREMAAEAGYLDQEFGDAATAVANSTPDDLLKAIDQELAGKPRWSVQEQGEVIKSWLAHESKVAARQQYRRIVEEIDSAIDALGIEHKLDDTILRRASRMAAEDGDDPIVALERALEEDYRLNLDEPGTKAVADVNDPDFEIPFFDDVPANAGTGPAARGDAGALGAEGRPGDGRSADPDGGELPRVGGAEEQAPGLRQTGDTPEPGTPEAQETAALALTEATRAGDQILIDGVAPVSTRQRLEAQGAKPMRGGNAAPPAGGLFDLDARDQIDMWDAIPAARKADGGMLYTSHADMVAEADRADFLGDLIASCRD